MNDLNATLQAVKLARSQPLADAVTKAFSQATGLVNFDLEGPAKLLYPVLTPLRNRIPRVAGAGGTATNWKTITNINTTNVRAGVSEGNRNATIVDSVNAVTAAYKGIGLENFSTFEGDYAAEGFDDARAKAVLNLLNSVMIQEERSLLGGNASLAMGVTPTPVPSTATVGGTIAAATQSVICVALSLVAFREASVAAGVPLSGNRTNADASVDAIKGGYAGKSAAAAQVTTGATSTVSATVTAVNGAAGYAWYLGVAGSELLAAITTINSVLLIAPAAGTQNASALLGTDQSQDALIFDGLLTQIMTPGSGAYNIALATGTAGTGTPLTPDGAGGLVQLDAAFQAFWDNFRLSPTEMYVSANTLLYINKLVIANGGAPLIRFAMDSGGMQINAGTVIGTYLNKPLNKQVKVTVHPDMPTGMILFYSDGIPYPLANVNNILQVKTRREYYQIEWPLRTRKYEFGVYADELLQNYFPPAFGVLKNIGVV